MALVPGFSEIKAHELVNHLLTATGQTNDTAVNAASILGFLQLEYLKFDFVQSLPRDALPAGREPRALISFEDRVVAVHADVVDRRERFSVFHEIGHYVLPAHVQRFFLCDASCLDASTKLAAEKEANSFAADLLFHGDLFTLETNSHPLTAKTVKKLADKYDASYEATVRRMVERSYSPCMLITFARRNDATAIEGSGIPAWDVLYIVYSPSFGARYFAQLNGALPPEVAVVFQSGPRDIADSFTRELQLGDGRRPPQAYHAEFFSNTYNIFCILTPSANS